MSTEFDRFVGEKLKKEKPLWVLLNHICTKFHSDNDCKENLYNSRGVQYNTMFPPLLVWLLSEYSGFLPWSKDMDGVNNNSKLAIVVNVSVDGCLALYVNPAAGDQMSLFK